MNLVQASEIYQRYKASSVISTISPNDDMWKAGQDWYFSAGENAIEIILSAFTYSWLNDVQSILDLPCGFGRVTRHLLAAFPKAQISCCDLNQEGVDFCQEAFSATGIYSHPDLLQVPLAKYDLIWIGSLFTHLAQYQTASWLAYLSSCLNDNGILIGTFHGVWSIVVHEKYGPLIDDTVWPHILRQYEQEGYGYAPYPNSEDSSYGVSLVSSSKLMEIASQISGIRILSYTERAWTGNHDVLVLGRADRLQLW